MALFSRNKTPSPEPKPRAIVASAVDLTDRGVAAWRARTGEDTWQRDAWYMYDAIGELRYALGWIANAVSMADVYIAEIDEDTGLISGPTDDPRLQRLAAGVLGGPGKRSQNQASIALNWQVAGEVFLLVRSRPNQDDEWIVLSTTEVFERSGEFSYNDPVTGLKEPINRSRDLLIRIWSPHPRVQSHADSAIRSALPTLREIERTSANIMARLDSRLASAGLLLLPEEVDFATGDDDPVGPEGIMQMLARHMEASLSNPGSASSQVPITLQIPGEQIPNVTHLAFSTELSSEVLELRSAGIRRLATALDMPAEVMLGMGEANHWSAWQIEEGAYKINVAPLLDRLADGITVAWLRGMLRVMGYENPERYTLAFDVTDIVTRPNRVSEVLELWDRDLVSDDAMRQEAGVPDTDAPDDEEARRRLVQKLVLADSSLLAVPGVAEVLGLPEGEAGAGGTVPQLEQAQPDDGNAIPDRPEQSEESDTPNEGLVAAAELVVYDALKRAGGRLLTRQYRGQYGHVPKFELHTVIPCSDVERALEGSFEFVDRVSLAFGVGPSWLERSLREYTRHLIRHSLKHNREELSQWLHPMSR